MWPLSNDARSKQFLKLLPSPGGKAESMVQRVVRQLREAGMEAHLTVATAQTQHDSVISQLGTGVSVVTEPERRDTFPAICLACEYLSLIKGCADSETVLVMPCDPYTESGYFKAVAKMAEEASKGEADLLVIGIQPTYPSAKYGYIVPDKKAANQGRQTEVLPVARFTEKPDPREAAKLIEEGGMWNGGVFAFKLGFLLSLARQYAQGSDFQEIRKQYSGYPKISFDYEVAENISSIAMVPYSGRWKDLGTWNTLTDELDVLEHGNVTVDGTGSNTHIFNELDIPLMCIGTRDLVVAASPDGILVSEKSKSESIREYAASLRQRPMYEERRWGTYRVIYRTETPDGFCSLTKHLTLRPGASISYQRHNNRAEVWTFVEGTGEIVLDGVRKPVKRGDTVVIPIGMMHCLKADTQLSFIEVQTGGPLVEEDIERFPYDWEDKDDNNVINYNK